ncbi:MAG TPA: hypothetical protein PLN69_05015 [bacterium]|nr:hypothetical protein [bacterium]
MEANFKNKHFYERVCFKMRYKKIILNMFTQIFFIIAIGMLFIALKYSIFAKDMPCLGLLFYIFSCIYILLMVLFYRNSYIKYKKYSLFYDNNETLSTDRVKSILVDFQDDEVIDIYLMYFYKNNRNMLKTIVDEMALRRLIKKDNAVEEFIFEEGMKGVSVSLRARTETAISECFLYLALESILFEGQVIRKQDIRSIEIKKAFNTDKFRKEKMIIISYINEKGKSGIIRLTSQNISMWIQKMKEYGYPVTSGTSDKTVIIV